MNWYRADLHIHSVLSPCGDLNMSPARIIQEAKDKKLDIIGISDHNSTLHAKLMMELGKKNGITVFPGVEVTTQEEVHCLAFFENIEATNHFQEFLDKHLIQIKNNSKKFGHQLLVNEKEEILNEINNLLIVGLAATIEEVEKRVHELKGVFIPAHVDKTINSIYSQIGFIPKELAIDAIEFSANITKKEVLKKRPELKTYSLITNSDAHFPEQMAKVETEYFLEGPTFEEWKLALKAKEGRKTRIR